ncbi:hypothetical protein U5801_07220 [Lamprobacter modestohalophilus]|nr:hypothetical protein [Lamprobacter modestohalophilus]MEA1049595.1 hypothetical protein [Lamprobacter modestohalophilus]
MAFYQDQIAVLDLILGHRIAAHAQHELGPLRELLGYLDPVVIFDRLERLSGADATQQRQVAMGAVRRSISSGAASSWVARRCWISRFEAVIGACSGVRGAGSGRAAVAAQGGCARSSSEDSSAERVLPCGSAGVAAWACGPGIAGSGFAAAVLDGER